ncbi:hypothetical protein BCR42DRAFT_339277, partial [Absidia repens]
KKQKTKRGPRQVQAAQIMFQPPPSKQKFYDILYIPSRHRVARTQTRQKLRSLGIQTHRILDIHYPARNIVALMVHEDYGTTLRQTFEKNSIPIVDFDPLDPDNLDDPQYVDMDITDRRLKAQEFQTSRLLRALCHARPHVFKSLAKTMVDQGWLTEEDVDDLDANSTEDLARKEDRYFSSPEM